MNFSGVADKFRNNADVFKTIKYIFEAYGADQELTERVISHIKENIKDSVSKLCFNSERGIGRVRRGADSNLLSVSVCRQNCSRDLRERPQRKRNHNQTCVLPGSR